MSDRTIASRPTLEQVVAVVEFMEKHPALALGQLRGLEGRDESKKLWLKLTKIVNHLEGPTRPMKSWMKFWADKKSTVRAKVQGDSCNLSSNIEKKIYDLFIVNNESQRPRKRSTVKEETSIEDSFFNEDSFNESAVEHDAEPILDVTYNPPVLDVEERQTAIIEKLVKVMGDQAAAMSQLALASHANSQAVERLAEAAQIQARALDRLATTFESITSATHDISAAIVDIDTSMKRYYSTSPA